MPRPLVFGNGRLLVQIDSRGNIRDLGWPIGIWNHLTGHAIRIGVWADGLFQWMDGFGWNREQRYEDVVDELVGHERHENAELGVRLTIVDRLAPRGAIGPIDAFQRSITVENMRASSRDVRVFFAHDLRLLENDVAECALWHPVLAGILHYKGAVALLLRASGECQYTCGEASGHRQGGSGGDAEDGQLEGVPISQGTTDSCLGVNLKLEAHESREFTYQMVFAESIPDLEKADLGGLFGGIVPSSTSRNSSVRFHTGVICTQASTSGAILAANDSDIMRENRANYSCCWPRDGSLVAEELLQLDDADGALGWCLPRALAERFLRFGLAVLRDRPYFLQKYRADGRLGPSWHPWTVELPIQLDETASFVSFVVACREAGLSLSPEDLDQGLTKPTKFLLDYRESDLPKPSYDLWEERRGVFVYTVASVVKALRDVVRVQPSRTVELAADRMAEALRESFWNDSHGFFQRGLDDSTIDASSLQIGILGVLPITDERVQANARAVEEALWVAQGIGGLARYPGDYYHRVNERHPGNPWIITTLWLAQHEALSGRTERARDLLQWALDHAHPSGLLPEQVHPETGEALSVSPLTWSHAELLKTLRLLA